MRRVVVMTTDSNALLAFLRGHKLDSSYAGSASHVPLTVRLLDLPASLVEELASQPGVLGVFDALDPIAPDGIDPAPTPMSNLTRLAHGVDGVWAQGYDGSGVRIGVVDTGVDFANGNLQGTEFRFNINGLSAPALASLSPAKWRQLENYSGWPMVYDPVSMETYLTTGLPDDTWFVNATSFTDVNQPLGDFFSLNHRIKVDGRRDFAANELWGKDKGGDAPPKGQGEGSDVRWQTPTAILDDFDLFRLFVAKDPDFWYFGFDTNDVSNATVNGRFLNRTYELVLDVDNATSGGYTGPLGKLWDSGASHNGAVNSVAYSPDGTMVATASIDKTIRIWSASTFALLRTLEGHTGPVGSVVWALNGAVLVSLDNAQVKVWDTATWNVRTNVSRSNSGDTEILAANPNGTWVAVGGRASPYLSYVYDVANLQPVGCIRHGSPTVVRALAFNPGNGSYLAMGTEGSSNNVHVVPLQGNLYAWNTATDTCSPAVATNARTLTGFTKKVNALAWEPLSFSSAVQLVAGSDDSVGEIRVWQPFLSTISTLSRTDHPGEVQGVAWSGDRMQIISVDAGGFLYVWDAGFGLVDSTQISRRAALSVHWSPSGTRYATADGDAKGRLWDLPRTYVVTFTQALPDYVIALNLTAGGWGTFPNNGTFYSVNNTFDVAMIYSWNTSTSRWDSIDIVRAGGRQAYVSNVFGGKVDNGFVELAIPKAALGDPEGFGFELIVTADNATRPQDSVPHDGNIDSNDPTDVNDPLVLDWTSDVASLSALKWRTPDIYHVALTGGNRSTSGIYYYGPHPSQKLRGTLGLVAVLVADTQTAGVYDRVYVDLDNDRVFRDTDVAVSKGNEYAFLDNFNHTAKLAGDAPNITTPDGVPDVSAGILYYISDGANPIPYSDQWIARNCAADPANDLCESRAKPPPGQLVAFFGEFGADAFHGTFTASVLAAQGKVAADEANPLLGPVKGLAPGAKLIAVGNSLASPFEAWWFTVEGYDGVVNSGDEAHVVMTGFTYPQATNDGWDVYSRFLDYASTILSKGRALFVAAAGNDGYGYGTLNGPGGAPTVLTVGSGSDFRYDSLLWSPTGAENIYPRVGEVAASSSRGPTAQGDPKPDALAVDTAKVDTPLLPGGDGAISVISGVWQGSTVAAAVAAGLAALLYDAYFDFVHAVNDEFVLRTIAQTASSGQLFHYPVVGMPTFLLNGTIPITGSVIPATGQVTFSPPVPPESTVTADYSFQNDFPDAATAKELLMSSADDRGYNPLLQGAGFLNATRAVAMATETSGFSVTPSAWTPGAYHGAKNPMFAKILTQGGSDSTTFRVRNHAVSSASVTVTGEAYRRQPNTTYVFVNQSDDPWFISDGGVVAWMNASGIFVAKRRVGFPNYQIISMAAWSAAEWAAADMVKVTAAAKLTGKDGFKDVPKDPKRLGYIRDDESYLYSLTLSDWNWTDEFTNPERFPQPLGLSWELNTLAKVENQANVLSAVVGRPAANTHTAMAFVLKAPDNTRHKQGNLINWTFQIELYKREPSSWFTFDGLPSLNLNVAGDSSATLTARVDIPTDTVPGSYEAVVRVAGGGQTTLVPVLVNVPSEGARFDLRGPRLGLAFEPYLLGGGFNGGLMEDAPVEQSGDWRFFFVDIPETGLFARPSDLKLYVDVDWDHKPTDIDVHVFARGGPVTPNVFIDTRYQPYQLDRRGGSFSATTGPAQTPYFNTTTNTSREIVTVSFTNGLNVVGLRLVQLNGSEAEEPFAISGGFLRVTPTELIVPTRHAAGSTKECASSNLGFPNGIKASAVGPATVKKVENAEIQDDAAIINLLLAREISFVEALARGNYTYQDPDTYLKGIRVENALIFEVHIVGRSDTRDLDLGVFLDKNGDSQAQSEEFVTLDADADADEKVKILNPQNGFYIIKVLGFDVPAGKGHLDVEIAVTLAGVKGYQVRNVPEGAIDPLDTFCFDMTWAFEGEPEEREYGGLISFGPPEAPTAILVPVTVIYDRTPPEILDLSVTSVRGRVDAVTGLRTDDRQPAFTVSLTDTRGRLVASSVQVFVKGQDVTAFAIVTVTLGQNAQQKWGYWDGTVRYVPPAPLSEGRHSVVVRAGDQAGNVAERHFDVDVDTVGPPLVLSGEEVSVVSNGSFLLQGSTVAGAAVDIIGFGGTIAPTRVMADVQTGAFVVPLTFTPGVNEVEVRVVDWSGIDIEGRTVAVNPTALRRTFLYDVLPPEFLDVRVEPSNLTASGTVTVGGRLRDPLSDTEERDPSFLAFTVNDVPVAVRGDGSFSAVVVLQEGPNDLVLRAVDGAGLEATRALEAVRDTAAPSLLVDDVPETVTGASLTIRGSAEPGSIVVVNGGQFLEVPADGRFEFAVTLSPGANDLVLEARDKAGNAQFVRRTVVFELPTWIPMPWSVALVLLAIGLLGGTLAGFARPLGGPAEGPETPAQVDARRGDEQAAKLRKAYDEGRISKEAYESNLKRLGRAPETPKEKTEEKPPAEKPPKGGGGVEERAAKLQGMFERGTISREAYEENLRRLGLAEPPAARGKSPVLVPVATAAAPPEPAPGMPAPADEKTTKAAKLEALLKAGKLSREAYETNLRRLGLSPGPMEAAEPARTEPAAVVGPVTPEPVLSEPPTVSPETGVAAEPEAAIAAAPENAPDVATMLARMQALPVEDQLPREAYAAAVRESEAPAMPLAPPPETSGPVAPATSFPSSMVASAPELPEGPLLPPEEVSEEDPRVARVQALYAAGRISREAYEANLARIGTKPPEASTPAPADVPVILESSSPVPATAPPKPLPEEREARLRRAFEEGRLSRAAYESSLERLGLSPEPSLPDVPPPMAEQEVVVVTKEEPSPPPKLAREEQAQRLRRAFEEGRLSRAAYESNVERLGLPPDHAVTEASPLMVEEVALVRKEAPMPAPRPSPEEQAERLRRAHENGRISKEAYESNLVRLGLRPPEEPKPEPRTAPPPVASPPDINRFERTDALYKALRQGRISKEAWTASLGKLGVDASVEEKVLKLRDALERGLISPAAYEDNLRRLRGAK